MPELIDRDALMRKHTTSFAHDNKHNTAEELHFLLECIRTAPIIHIMRRGEWLSYTGTHYTGKENEYGDPEYKEHIFFVCSNCRRKTVVREHFCPNCGARMDAAADQ